MKRILCIVAAGAMGAMVSAPTQAGEVADFYKGKTMTLLLIPRISDKDSWGRLYH